MGRALPVTAEATSALHRIVKVGDRVLTTRCATVPFPLPDDLPLADVAEGMFATMRDARGVGLAANQIGVGLRMFVFDSGSSVGVMVNPTLTPDRKRGLATMHEGCLSVPGLNVKRKRWNAVTVDGVDLEGRPQSWDAEGIEAQIFQHECDHLDGRLCFK